MRLDRSRFLMSTAVAALMLPLAASLAAAQSAGFSIEISPPVDAYTPMRVGARVFGAATEPAASFVRGCQGSVVPEASGALFDVTAPMDALAFTAAGEGLLSLVLGTPDGLFRCALADEQGLAVSQLAGVQPGRYTVWLGAAEGSQIDARLFAADQPVSALELFGLDLTRLGEPRAGRFVYSASVESGRQDLALGARLSAVTAMLPLSTEYCPGYSDFSAPDAVLTLDQATDRFSVFATSERDLTMAIYTPDGRVLCNDDALGLNPAITVEGAAAGDYTVFVGGYSQGGADQYDLFASATGPSLSNAVANPDAEPRNGYAVFDMNAAGQGQLLVAGMVTPIDPFEMLPIGDYCPGFTDVSAPDLVMTLESAQPMISLYARSSTDLVMAVRAPDGSWQCNDDSFELSPAISLTNAQPGDYVVFVGSYNPGMPGDYNLYASMGSPNWQASQSTGGIDPRRVAPASLAVGAEPAMGRLSFGPTTRIDPRVIFDIVASQTEAFGMGDGCAGFINAAQPDLVVSAEEGLPQLMVYVVSDNDGTLVVAGPDGTLYCNDDFEQLNPGVMIPNPMPGDYAVFAGSYSGLGGLATLGVTIASPLWVMDREH